MRRPPRATRTDTLFPYTTLFRSGLDFDRLVPMTACLIGGSTIDMVLRDRPGPVRLALDAHARPPHRLEPPHMGFGKRLRRSEEHTSELQSLMRISYAVFCLKTRIIPST